MKLYKSFLATKNKPLIVATICVVYLIFMIGRIFVNFLFTEFSELLNVTFLFLIFLLVSSMILLKYK
jgi:hypothetical protein